MKFYFLPLILILVSTQAAAAAPIEILQLRNRPAIEIIPIVEPLLAPGETISGRGFKLFLRASPQTLDEVQAVIDSLDTAARVLTVSVFQGHRSELRNLELNGSVRISNQGVSAGISAGESSNRSQGGPVHRLRVNEGARGYIATGSGYGGSSSGFYVKPRLGGDKVTFEISPFGRKSDPYQHGSAQILQADSVISGRLGEWLPLGSVSQQIDRSHGNGVSFSSTRGSSEVGIWIRADTVK